MKKNLYRLFLIRRELLPMPKDLAKTCLDILSYASSTKISKKGSLYHYSNEGVTSWYDFAAAIMEISNIDCRVIPIETKDYPHTS
jgi:dTDP-4-dehydrorhamnose reductase